MHSNKTIKKASKLVSFVLRHQPESIQLTLDTNGWANIKELIEKIIAQGEIKSFDRQMLNQVVSSNSDRRFLISEDDTKVRANQGHSVDVNLELSPMKPPRRLYHATTTKLVDDILEQGLLSQEGQHVHLSHDKATAKKMGADHVELAMLLIDTVAMQENGHVFYLSTSDVWLTDSVPVEFLTALED